MTGTDSYLQSLIVTNPLQEPVMRRVVRALNLPPESRGLDVGCGIGLQAIMLAEAVEAAGHVIGVDLSRSFWIVREALKRRQASLSKSPFGKGILTTSRSMMPLSTGCGVRTAQDTRPESHYRY